MKLLKIILPYAIIFILGMLFLRECNREKTIEKEVIREITVTVPEVKHVFDTVFVPVPKVIRKTDTIILQDFLNASDSLKIALYEHATKEREYSQTFRDSVQEINVFSKVRGEMLSQAVDYTVFERTVSVQDTVRIKNQRLFYLVPEIGYGQEKIKARLGLMYIDRGQRLYKASIDTDKTVWGGYGLKF